MKGGTMIKFINASFMYEEISEVGEKEYRAATGIKNINLHIKEGECLVLCGVSGCGKTSLSRMINGLIPHFYHGSLEGEVLANEVNMSQQAIAKTAEKVGSVFQNPRTQFFNVDTTSELAFGCENLGVAVNEIGARIEEASEKLNLKHLMDRSIFELSGGEKQRIACGSVYATHPDIFVMDEPSSSLDKSSIIQLKGVIETLKKMGKTVIIAEHRLHYLRDVADRFVYMQEGEIKSVYDREDFLKLSLDALTTKGLRTLDLNSLKALPVTHHDKKPSITIKHLSFSRGKREILNIESLALFQHEIVALIGDNGAGKTTLAHCLCGLEKFKGVIEIDGKVQKNKDLTARSFMVMQDVNAQLFTESVAEELLLNIEEPDKEKVDKLLKALNLEAHRERHPMALSGGQKQRVAIASAMMAGKDMLIYDEPTSGLDWDNMNRMSELIRDTEKNSLCTMIITHDPELIFKTCDRVIHLKNGQVFDSYLVDNEGVEKIKNYFIG
jgi:energy-coupling factor transport system ATP-binding protein